MQQSPEAIEIRRRMEEVRRDLDVDVQKGMEDARGINQWIHYVKAYPWACMGAAVVAGYLLVPPRQMPQPAEPFTSGDQPGTNPLSASPPLSSISNVRGVLLNALANLAMKTITSYVEHQADKLLAAQKCSQATMPPERDGR